MLIAIFIAEKLLGFLGIAYALQPIHLDTCKLDLSHEIENLL